MAEWTPADVRGTLQVLPYWWDLLTDGVAPDVLEAQPRAGGRSVRDLQAALAQRSAAASEGRLTAEELVASALDDLSAAARTLHALGAGTPSTAGAVAGVHVSDGGVPKRPVESASVDAAGVVGDRQADRRFHGRSWQALCLWSREVIDALVAEGHPIAPGNAGENLTLAGLDWPALRPGTRMRIGGVLAELSVPAPPCAKNARWFRDGDFMQMDHARHPGRSRWYATVLEPGDVAAGAPVVVEPAVTEQRSPLP